MYEKYFVIKVHVLNYLMNWRDIFMKKLFITLSLLGLLIGCSKEAIVPPQVTVTGNTIPEQQVVPEEDQIEPTEDKVIMSDLPLKEVVLNLLGNGNMESFYEFRENMKLGTADRIRITAFTKEGDPIYKTIEYDGEVMTYTYDNSEDKFGGDDIGKKSDTCRTIEGEQEGLQSQYYFTDCTTNADNMSYLIVSVPFSESDIGE